jgi:hypothetical protein
MFLPPIKNKQRKGEGRQFFPYDVAIVALCSDFTIPRSENQEPKNILISMVTTPAATVDKIHVI